MHTRDFRLSKSRYFMLMFLYEAPAAGLCLLIMLVALMVLGPFVGWIVTLVGIMLLALLTLFLLPLLYIWKGFKPFTAANMNEHSLRLEEEEMLMSFTTEDGEDVRTLRIPLSTFGGYSILPGGVILQSKDKKEGWLWIPVAAFGTPSEINPFLEYITEHKI